MIKPLKAPNTVSAEKWYIYQDCLISERQSLLIVTYKSIESQRDYRGEVFLSHHAIAEKPF